METPEKRKRWPVVIKVGAATAKIYLVKRRKAGKEYVDYRLVYYDSDRARRFESFSKFLDAEKAARRVAATITRGEAKALTLTADDRLVYIRALEALKGLDVSLDSAAVEYAAAKKAANGRSLIDAARLLSRRADALKSATVRAVVEELVALREQRTKKGTPASDKYLRDLRHRLGRFADAFQMPIDKVTPELIEAFTVEQKLTGRTRHNHLRLIKTLFRYAQSKGYYPKELAPLDGIETGFEDDSDIQIFTPDEFRHFLAHAWPELIPFITIGAFAGLRHAEAARLDWSDIKANHIEVTRRKAKTRSRRLVPMLPNLSKWLADHRQSDGPVARAADMSRDIETLVTDARAPWKRNGLRHSFISYRMAILKDENAVALEAGNSPQMIFRNYRQLVTAEQAKEWFSIVPKD